MTRPSPVARTAQRLLNRIGKQYVIDEHVPDGLLVREVLGRALQLLRGLVRFQRLVFVGSAVSVRGRRHLTLGRGATVGAHTRIDAYGTRGVTLGARSKLGDSSLVTTTSHLARFGEGLTL